MDKEDMINALKNGNVPKDGARELCIGRDKEIEEFEYILERVKEGKSVVKFIDGEFGAGKSFFLKVIEEMAYQDNFVISKVTLSNSVPFNKIDVVYRNIVQSLTCKTGTSLRHIIDRWYTDIRVMALEETTDPVEEEDIVRQTIQDDLRQTREHSNSFAVAIENYCKFLDEGDEETANYAQAWLQGDSNIPSKFKRKFGVKGDVTKENTFNFIEALSVFIKSVGYSGLVVLIDEAEYIMNLIRTNMRDTAYNYMRDIFDLSSSNEFENILFVFAGTPRLFDDTKKGIPSYEALNDRIEDKVDSEYRDLRKPIIVLQGFTDDELVDISKNIISLHEDVYDWNGQELVYPVLDDIVEHYQQNASLTGGRVTPRLFVRSIIAILDIIQQNPDDFTSSEDILNIFDEKQSEFIDYDFDDDWG